MLQLVCSATLPCVIFTPTFSTSLAATGLPLLFFIFLDILLFHCKRSNKGHSSQGYRSHKQSRQCIIGCFQHTSQILGLDILLQISCPSTQNYLGV